MTALLAVFAERVGKTDSVLSMMVGMFPLVKSSITKIDPATLTAVAAFFRDGFSGICDPTMSASDYEKWLSKLQQDSGE